MTVENISLYRAGGVALTVVSRYALPSPRDLVLWTHNLKKSVVGAYSQQLNRNPGNGDTRCFNTCGKVVG